MSYPNQYVGGLSPQQKARRWKPKKWFKARHMEDLCDPRARLIPIYSSGGVRNNPMLLALTFYIYCAYKFSVKATIDLHEMDHEDLAELCDKCFSEMSSSEKEDFMRLNLYEADDDDIEEYYLDNIDKGMKEEDDSLSPSSLENEQRCLLLADTLSAFSCSRLRPTLPEALDVVKQMYNFMGWK